MDSDQAVFTSVLVVPLHSVFSEHIHCAEPLARCNDGMHLSCILPQVLLWLCSVLHIPLPKKYLQKYLVIVGYLSLPSRHM